MMMMLLIGRVGPLTGGGGGKEARPTNQTWLPLPTRSDTGEDAPLPSSSSPLSSLSSLGPGLVMILVQCSSQCSKGEMILVGWFALVLHFTVHSERLVAVHSVHSAAVES